MTPQIIEDIVRQHAEEAAFLWLLRNAAVHAPHYALGDLEELDERVEAHIDGLRVAGDPGWELCIEQLENAEAGEVFAAAVMALEHEEDDRLAHVFSVAESADEALPGLISAFGWQSPNALRGRVSRMLVSHQALDAYVGIATCAIHRADPGEQLDSLLAHDSPLVRRRALRAAGELTRLDVAGALGDNMYSDDELCRFWASWSLALIGDARGHGVLSEFSRVPGPLQYRALNLVLRAAPVDQSIALVRDLASDSEQTRAAIVATGIVGLPVSIPWIVQHMTDPEHARVAGEAFSLITGIDLAYDDLEADWPDGFEAGPSEAAEEDDVELDADEDLPWPDTELIERWWEAHRGNFSTEARYLCGTPVSPASCTRALREGFQRQRSAAALELCLLRGGPALFEIRAPAKRQSRLLDNW